MPRRAKQDYEVNSFEKGEHAEDLDKLARDSIRLYFKDKSWFCGGPVPREELLSDDSVKTVLRSQFDDRCFDFIHDQCLTQIPPKEDYYDPTLPWTVHYLLQMLQELWRLGIPKDFQPGLILLYFKFCKGIDILPPPLL